MNCCSSSNILWASYVEVIADWYLVNWIHVVLLLFVFLISIVFHPAPVLHNVILILSNQKVHPRTVSNECDTWTRMMIYLSLCFFWIVYTTDCNCFHASLPHRSSLSMHGCTGPCGNSWSTAPVLVLKAKRKPGVVCIWWGAMTPLDPLGRMNSAELSLMKRESSCALKR